MSVSRDVDPSTWCGDKELKVGLADGVGGNPWRQITKKVVELEVAKCPALDQELLYTNANGDPQKASSDIASQVSQGVDVLLVYADFGAAELPALRAATAAGVTVVPYSADPGGKVGQDYSAKIVGAYGDLGADLGNWLTETLSGKGNVVFLGGIPGAPSSGSIMEGITSSLEDQPDMKLLQDEPVTTNWNKVDTQKAINGLLAKYPEIDGIMTDYGVTAVAAIDAFQAAGKPVPPIATFASNNELGCKWVDAKTGGDAFPIFSLDSSNDVSMMALRLAVPLANGEDGATLQQFRFPPFLDSEAGQDPKCDRNLPPDADLSSSLTPEQLSEVFN
ncbi:substrate-binding domain-containing protein [Nocardioides cavernae]|uniref:Substrate-binding domain-containing protein n=1 Tax=Nocardioides cavernae TaxID=1921566 RepID=A0ABR8NAP8_9ACTN|nr:substrate-binding domain-containing protein [Nocardioides cavernae]MBD3924255.1 substrate-binding domain-containing protein [Nocardioides cavernae]MBM7510806.1 ribose transport system substrate-binding protein [Nocardioides cavernae]